MSTVWTSAGARPIPMTVPVTYFEMLNTASACSTPQRAARLYSLDHLTCTCTIDLAEVSFANNTLYTALRGRSVLWMMRMRLAVT